MNLINKIPIIFSFFIGYFIGLYESTKKNKKFKIIYEPNYHYIDYQDDYELEYI